MANIKFPCPHCKKALSVKVEFAGKKGPCPHCKKVVTVPAPKAAPAPAARPAAAPAPAPPAVDAEALAASVLGEQQAAAAPPEDTRTVDFTCPQCDAELHLPADLAGKRSQCPECKRIIPVPQLVKTDPKDWRKVDTRRPSGARTDTEPAPEGAWGNAPGGAAVVSAEALLEADAVPQVREPVTLRQRLRQVAIYGGIAVALIVGVLLGWSYLTANWQEKSIAAAKTATKAAFDKKEISREAAAEVYRAAGEYYLHTDARRCVERANPDFQESRRLLSTPGKPTTERDFMLIDLALTQVDMGADEKSEEVSNGQRLAWDKVSKEVGPTLEAVVSPEGRVLGVQEVSRKLIAKGQLGYAVGLSQKVLAASDNARPDAIALVGLEVFRNNPADAEKLAIQAVDRYAQLKNKPKPSTAFTALGLVIKGQNQKLGERLPPEVLNWSSAPEPDIRHGAIVAFAHLDRLADAKKVALDKFQTEPSQQLEAFIAIGNAVAAKDPKQAEPFVEDAFQLLEGELKGKQQLPWVMWRLVRLAVQTGKIEQAKAIAVEEQINDAGLLGRAQLEILRAQLAASGSKAEAGQADAVSNKTPAHLLAREAIPRHNARLDAGTLREVGSWEENVRPFGQVGAALGVQDAKK